MTSRNSSRYSSAHLSHPASTLTRLSWCSALQTGNRPLLGCYTRINWLRLARDLLCGVDILTAPQSVSLSRCLMAADLCTPRNQLWSHLLTGRMSARMADLKALFDWGAQTCPCVVENGASASLLCLSEKAMFTSASCLLGSLSTSSRGSCRSAGQNATAPFAAMTGWSTAADCTTWRLCWKPRYRFFFSFFPFYGQHAWLGPSPDWLSQWLLW